MCHNTLHTALPLFPSVRNTDKKNKINMTINVRLKKKLHTALRQRSMRVAFLCAENFNKNKSKRSNASNIQQVLRCRNVTVAKCRHRMVE